MDEAARAELVRTACELVITADRLVNILNDIVSSLTKEDLANFTIEQRLTLLNLAYLNTSSTEKLRVFRH